MKLYATITSERASKGQGGKELDIRVQDETKKEFLRVQVREYAPEFPGHDNFVIEVSGCGIMKRHHYVKTTKGNKQ